ncbi:MAG: dihydrofolate reductase family protein [Candidatus Marinimicrobia bacterium]|nr:dihydrofolate reductase family protein [Candidatus Neomarinimicrobiota bacterium]MCF7901983.1 dihydrofolate reductase family protein [Candidatus Neomarinimicrobiota bacterium]
MNLNQQIEQWLSACRENFPIRQRPFVTLAYAQSWDGSIAHQAGESLALSGDEAHQLTHQLRTLHDGILVGVGTILADNPRLTARAWTGPNPQPVVLDSRLRVPMTAQLFKHPDHEPWIFTTHPGKPGLAERARLFSLPPDEQGYVPLVSTLEILWEQGISSLMVEGGSRVITNFLKTGSANALILTIAPRFIGGYNATGDLGSHLLDKLPKLNALHSAPLGEDQIVWGTLDNAGGQR